MAHGTIGVYVDCKELSAAALVAALRKTDMLNNVVIYGDPGVLKGVLAIEPSLRAMPEAENAVTLEKTRVELESAHPRFRQRRFQDRRHRGGEALARQDLRVVRLWDADKPADWQDAIGPRRGRNLKWRRGGDSNPR